HGKALYVGKARRLRMRVASYTRPTRLPVRLQRMIAATRSMEFITTESEGEALLLEANLIKKLAPRYNILLRDDKSFPAIRITDHADFPRVIKYRGKRTRGNRYFGPYASTASVNKTLMILQRAFGLRDCTDHVFANRTRPCLQYHIKRCSGPCDNRISKQAYGANLDRAVAFLKGGTREVQDSMVLEMKQAAERQEYEHAARLRDQVKALTQVQAHQDINVQGIGDGDFFALARQGGASCIQAFFLRGGSNNGGRAYFPRHDRSATDSEVMSAFLGQFYTLHSPPDSILVNVMPRRADLLEQALCAYFDCRLTIRQPKRGAKLRALLHCTQNAEGALARMHADRANQQDLVEKLAELCRLDHPVQRIEIYDNSHLQGSFQVGVMVVAGPDGFHRKAYRTFNIKPDHGRDTKTTAQTQAIMHGGDDYAMMAQVMRRRFSRGLAERAGDGGSNWPDLVMLDGGKGQLSAARSVFEELGIAGELCYLAVAKGKERNKGQERLYLSDGRMIALDPRDPLQFFIQRLRDEAHRFVIGAHRARRGKAIRRSRLDEVASIGPGRKQQLLHHFGSARAVANASLQDLRAVHGISERIARRIYDYFHED
ncbi:MAG: excinuclease ABC subunit UvrC, partial [Pseudomonadota bacterium]